MEKKKYVVYNGFDEHQKQLAWCMASSFKKARQIFNKMFGVGMILKQSHSAKIVVED